MQNINPSLLAFKNPVLRSRLACIFFISPYSANLSLMSSSWASSLMLETNTIQPSTAILQKDMASQMHDYASKLNTLSYPHLWLAQLEFYSSMALPPLDDSGGSTNYSNNSITSKVEQSYTDYKYSTLNPTTWSSGIILNQCYEQKMNWILRTLTTHKRRTLFMINDDLIITTFLSPPIHSHLSGPGPSEAISS